MIARRRFPMPRRSSLALPYCAVLLAATAGNAQSSGQRTLALDVFAGGALNLPSRLRIDHEGERIGLTARYRTDPFTRPIYWSVRLTRGRAGGSAMELELTHHKLVLDNPAPPLDHFEVTHGHNLLTGSMARPLGWATWRAGLGAVVAHVEQRIGGRPVDTGGYRLAGPVAVLGVGRRYALGGGRWAISAAPELRLSASWSRVSYDGGRVTAPNVALHLVGGAGVLRRQ